MTRQVLAGDIGGTNARLAIVGQGYLHWGVSTVPRRSRPAP